MKQIIRIIPIKKSILYLGMIFTVEPGIYIREENLGIRLENDIVIRQDGIEDLTTNIPIEPEEIEEIMNA